MYDVDDAVAKIDGYIISIAGAAAHVGTKRMVRIDQVGRTAASALLLDEAGEVVKAPTRSSTARGGRGTRRSSGADADGGRAGERTRSRVRGRRAPADSEGEEARREAGLHGSATGIDSEPEDEAAPKAVEVPQATAAADADEPKPADAPETPQDEGAEDGLQSKPRRRGRRGGRRRSAAKAPATPE
jgi:ribonuclease G